MEWCVIHEGLQGVDGSPGEAGLPGYPGLDGEKGEMGLEGFQVSQMINKILEWMLFSVRTQLQNSWITSEYKIRNLTKI